jgi:hypothetical protein
MAENAVVEGQQPAGEAGAGAAAPGAGAASAQPGTGTPAPAATPTGATSGFTYAEDRSKWIPPHRFNEVSQKARQVEALTTQLSEAQRRVEALAGVAPTDAAEQKAANIKAALLELVPELRPFIELSPEQRDALLQTPQFLARSQSQEQRGWQKHGNTQVHSISDRIAEALNVDALDDDQVTDVRENFAGWLKAKASAELEATGGTESKTLDRYENGDEKLLDEFVARYTKNWVDPARRQGVARTVNRARPVPSSGGRQAVSTVTRPDKFNSLDDRIEFAAKLAKERGAVFGR